MNGVAVEELRFPIMGSTGHLVVVGGRPGAGARAHARLDALEDAWSRFRPHSELSRLNAAGGMPCVVSDDLALLVDALCTAWQRTAGRFDPTVHDALRSLGYAASFPAVVAPRRLPSARATPGCGEVQRRARLVQVPVGVRLDPGGLGKGLAADVVAGELLADGAQGALVNVGGDLRVVGTAPDGGNRWRIAIEHPTVAGERVAVVDLADGGLATSTSARRAWHAQDGAPVHHLLDPSTGLPAVTSRVQVSVVAGSGWWAEVAAKVAFLDGELVGGAVAALTIDDAGHADVLGDPQWFTVVQAAEGALA